MDDAKASALLDAVFEFLCTRKVGELVDVATVVRGIDAVTAPDRMAGLIARFFAPGRARLLERAAKSTLKLSVWLPAPAKDALAQILAAPAPIPQKIIDEVVKSDRVREDMREMLLEAISSVMEKAFAAAPGGKGMRGLMAIGARAAGGLFGGIGEEVQRQLLERVRDVVDAGVAIVQRRLAEKLRSPETAKTLGKRRRKAFLALLERTEAEAGEFLGSMPHEALDALAPLVIAHNVARSELRDAVTAETTAVLAELDEKTIGELLDELGLRQLVRDALRAHGTPLVSAFLASPQFAAWSK